MGNRKVIQIAEAQKLAREWMEEHGKKQANLIGNLVPLK